MPPVARRRTVLKVDEGARGRQDGPTVQLRRADRFAMRRWEMGTKDKGGSKASKKPAQKSIKEKRQAKNSKKGR